MGLRVLRREKPEHLSSLIERVSSVAQFDIVVFNPITKILQVWRELDGEKIIVFTQEMTWINEKSQFKDLVILIGGVASLYCTSEEFSVPFPCWGYRFV